MPIEFALSAAVEKAVTGYVTQDELDSIATALNASLTKNASELSAGERDTVIEMVQSAIADAQAASDSITASQVSDMIKLALAQMETPLTEDQVQSIVNETVSSISGTSLIPDYSKQTRIKGATDGDKGTFFPLQEGVMGEVYTVTNDGFYGLVGSVDFSGTASLVAFDFFINGKSVFRSRGGPVTSIPFSTGLFYCVKGDTISVRCGLPSGIAPVYSHVCRLMYYPPKQATTSVAQQDLSLFATNTMMLDGDQLNSDTIDSHKTTDRFRWQDSYNDERNSIIRDAENSGLKPDETAIVTLDNPVEPFVVNDEAGGVIGVTMENVDGSHCTVVISGTQNVTYTSEGLTDNVPVTKYFWLHPGDTINSIGVEKYEYLPFGTDANSLTYLLTKQLEQTQAQLADLKAGVEGKVLDTDNAVDIESLQPYTVANTLGGRVHYTGLNVLITTWALYINDVAVRNGALLGLGTTQGDYDVNNGDVITSIGMTGITFTPYKAGA